MRLHLGGIGGVHTKYMTGCNNMYIRVDNDNISVLILCEIKPLLYPGIGAMSLN